MICSAMAELELVGLASQREPQNLVAEADAEDRRFAHQLANLLSLMREGLGIAGSVRKEHAVGLQGEDILGRSACWNHRDVAAGMHEAAQDVAFDAEIVG